MPDPTGATNPKGSPKLVKASYVVLGAEIVDGSFSRVFASTDVSSSQVVFLSIDQHQQGMHAARLASKSDRGSKRSHWMPSAVRIPTADDDGLAHGRQVQTAEFRQDVFSSLLSQIASNVEECGGPIEYARNRARVPLKHVPKSCEDDYREAFGPVIVAMNDKVGPRRL